MDAFHLEILAADRRFYDGPAESVIIPASDGQREFQAHHCPFVAAVVPGELKFRPPGGEDQLASVGAGIIKVANNAVLILVDSAERPDEIDANRAQRDMDAAMEAMRQKQSIREFRIVQANLARAMSRLRVKQRSSDNYAIDTRKRGR